MASDEREAPRAGLWDLDGTLADSKEYHWRSWQAALGAVGVEVSEAQFLASFGQRKDAILSEWLGATADPALIRNVGNEKEAIYRQIVGSEGVEPLPGAADWVRTLHEEGWRPAIASSAPRANVEVMQGALGFGSQIQVLVGAEDVSRGKPDPEVFLLAAERLGVPPGRCVVVEDAEAGVEAARRGGMVTIGGGGGRVEAADLVIPHFNELPPRAFDALVVGSQT